MIGGANPAPNPTPAKMIPFAMPRSAEGIHAEIMQFEAGSHHRFTDPQYKANTDNQHDKERSSMEKEM